VGDKVQTIYGSGTVQEVRNDGTAEVRIESWKLAEGQTPTAFLQKEHYTKVF
jgi:hypothetical protein